VVVVVIKVLRQGEETHLFFPSSSSSSSSSSLTSTWAMPRAQVTTQVWAFPKRRNPSPMMEGWEKWRIRSRIAVKISGQKDKEVEPSNLAGAGMMVVPLLLPLLQKRGKPKKPSLTIEL
jgi:hypothetical protein